MSEREREREIVTRMTGKRERKTEIERREKRQFER
jgi:hypothetical protein